MRLVLFTDTLNDINGVSRFIRTIAREAYRAEPRRELHVITSTRFEPPPAPPGFDPPTLHNSRPLFAHPMPGYPTLDVTIPPRRELERLARALKPDVVHISTPGPVGIMGRAIARRLRVPILGTYHTDFPAYIDHLFQHPSLTLAGSEWMRRFYAPFSMLFTRSDEYTAALERLGFPRRCVSHLRPGIDVNAFSPGFRPAQPEAFWTPDRFPGVRPGSLKVLYVGRISVEKSLPLLAQAWPLVRTLLASMALDAQLLVVGDGPYRADMQRLLGRDDAIFLGFRHGAELSAIYAACDLFVFPSCTDTLGQSVMEAQAAGLPVIVSDVGGPRSVVDRGRTGLVMPSQSVRAWAEGIAMLLADTPRRTAMSLAAAAKIAPMSIRASFDHFWREHERFVSR